MTAEEEDNNHEMPPSLRQIENDMATVEQSLQNPRSRSGGQGVFASVTSMLSSLQRRIDLHINTDCARRSLSDRLRQAQEAHSNRVPLNLLRDEQSMEQRSEERRSLMLNMANHPKSDGEPPEEKRRRPINRSSSLVASRRKIDDLEAVDKDLHASGQNVGVSIGLKLELDNVEVSSEEHMKDDDELEIPPLLSKASRESLSQISSRRISGSVFSTPEESSVVFSWGGVHSLHDDSAPRSVENAMVPSMDRIGRLTEIVSVACGPNHLAVASQAGSVYTAGDNVHGAVAPFEAQGPIVVRPTLVESLGQTLVQQVSCGWNHTAVVTSTGAVLTWGNNELGQLGHYYSNMDVQPITRCRPKAMRLGPGTRAASVACGNQFTMVLTTRMCMMMCGALSREEKALPRQLPALVGLPISAIAAGKDHAVVVTVFGSAYSWGSNVGGCCGRPFPAHLSSPVPMVTPKSDNVETPLGSVNIPKLDFDGTTIQLADEVAVLHAACGDQHTVLVTRSGRLLVCGSNDNGQLGLPCEESVEHLHPVHHPLEYRKFESAEAGSSHILLLDDAGDVWQSEGGTLKPVLSGKSVLTIAAGGEHFIALSSGGFGAHREFSVSNEHVSIPHDLETLIQMVAHLEKDDMINTTGHELIKRLEELLKHPSLLNSLFLDLQELDHLYGELTTIKSIQLRQALSQAIENSIMSGLESLQAENAQLKYPSAVRCILHYLRFFDRQLEESFDPLGTCVATLCETLLNLPYEGFKHLLAWLTLYPSELFVKMLVKPLLSQLNKALQVDVDPDGVQHQKVSRRSAPVIVAVLRWLYVASQRKNLASPECFYCDAVSMIPIENLYQDLMTKKSVESNHRPHGILLSENQFLIPPSTKRDLLQIESQVSMIKVAMMSSIENVPTIQVQQDGVTVNPYFVLEINREHILDETLKAIKEASPKDLQKKLRIKFTGEDGVDAGGVAKEFFQLLSEELFDINSGLWTKRFGEGVTWFNSDCTWDEEGFELVGVLVGLALYNSVLLDVHFPPAVYRKLLDKPLGLEDLIDKELMKGLKDLLDYNGNDVEDVFCLTFEVTWMDLGKEQTVELKPNGANIEVTSANKEEYVLLYVKWLLVDSIQPQWEAFRKGVDRIMQGSSLRDLFSPEELELLVVGTPILDFAALESNTEYEGGYDENSAVVKNLWKFVKNSDHATQVKFLRFTTGSSKAPIGGLGALKFKVQRAGADSQQLPTSHTCFNTLLLPDYGENCGKLQDLLGRAILECEGFGLE